MRRDRGRSVETTGGTAPAGSSPRLYQRVFDIIASQIEQGALTADSIVTEAAVASRFGVSRAPARRALAELVRQGLLTARADGPGFVIRQGMQQPAATATGAVTDATTPATAEKLVSLSSWERIYGEVESDIIARISFAAWRLNEAELARHYRVSRTVARDVIARLQQSGLVQKDDRSRWLAPALTSDHVSELYELRWLLEPVALIKAAPSLPPDMLPRMRADLEKALADPAAITGAMLDELEHDLHVKLLGHCGNRALMQAITYPQSLLIAHRFLYRWTLRLFGKEPLLPEHLEIIDLLQKGKAGDAAEKLETHLKMSRDRAITRIGVIASGERPAPLSYLEEMAPVA